MAKGDRGNAYKLLHGFLTQHANAGTYFKFDDIKKVVTSWKTSGTWETYVSKKLKPYVERSGDLYGVKKTFSKVTVPEFKSLFTQKTESVPRWARATYDHVVSYEFLMPLTREDKLRAALDQLFYRDEIDARTRVFDGAQLAELKTLIPTIVGEGEDAYRKRVADQLATLIGGYSISHVAGRFRVGDVVSRKEAAEKLVTKEQYLIDETTAVVRFIMPCPNSKSPHPDRFSHRAKAEGDGLDGDVDLIRTLFFLYFAEAIAATILGEQLIWLVERSPYGERIYEWEKASDTSDSAGTRTPKKAAATKRGSAAPSKKLVSVNAPGGQASRIARAPSTPKAASTEPKGSTRHWLRTNGYVDVAKMIDEVMAEWSSAGVTTRRNWWDVLAGDDKGAPRKVAGRLFPVLATAQRRQNKTVTDNSIQRSKSEPLPD